MTGLVSAIALLRRLIKMSLTAILLKRINTASARLIISLVVRANGSNIKPGWIDNVATQWTILHEIGHGYQGVFMNDVDPPVGEVWNNIYAAFFQQLNLNQGTIFIPTAGSMITGGSLSRNCNSLPICGIARRLAPGASDPVCNF